MRSSISLGFLNNSRPAAPNRQVNVADNHPGFGEALRALGGGSEDLVARWSEPQRHYHNLEHHRRQQHHGSEPLSIIRARHIPAEATQQAFRRL
jgi:hypothetical protein